jgi:transposase InsO family protein
MKSSANQSRLGNWEQASDPEAGVMPSMGSVGDGYDNAMAESLPRSAIFRRESQFREPASR